MNREFDFINIIKNTIENHSIGDDCAYIKDLNLAISSDSLIEDVHFSRLFMTPYEIAKKALLVNISDILASGAEPRYYTISLGGRDLDNNFIKDFYSGLSEVSKEYNLLLLGGDLVQSPKTIINITILGDTKGRNVSYRHHAKPSYIMAVLGEFGSSAQGLYELKQDRNVKDSEFIQIHKAPKLYPKISRKIATETKHPYAMMDSSDGLFDCLYQISNSSKVKISINYDKIPHKTQNRDFVLFGGEDYSLAIALHIDDFLKIPELVQIGTIEEGEGVFLDGVSLKYSSYEKTFSHFS